MKAFAYANDYTAIVTVRMENGKCDSRSPERQDEFDLPRCALPKKTGMRVLMSSVTQSDAHESGKIRQSLMALQ